MPNADINGLQVFYTDSGGDGPVVVLSHGFLMDHDMFDAQVAALSPRYRVITWDQRGHGETSATEESWSYWDSAEDLNALLDHLGVERAVVGGMSQGGFIALRFALKHPDRTTGLILIDTQAGVEDPDKTAQYDALEHVWTTEGGTEDMAGVVAMIIIGDETEHRSAWTAKWLARPSGFIAEPYKTLMSRDDIHDRLGEITAPAIVIHGEEDIAIELSKGEALSQGLPNSRGVVPIPGAGHASCLTHPEPANAAISDFLASLDE